MHYNKFIIFLMAIILPVIVYADNEIIIEKNILSTPNNEYYLYGYYLNGQIALDNFLYEDIDIPSIPIQAVKSVIQPQQMFEYGFEITAKDLNDNDFVIYWNNRLQFATLSTDEAKAHLYEYRVVKGVLIDYKRTSFAYSLYIKTEDDTKFRLYIPQNAYQSFKFKKIKSYLGKEIYAVSQIEKWNDIVMQIHHPNQIIYKESDTIFRLFERK